MIKNNVEQMMERLLSKYMPKSIEIPDSSRYHLFPIAYGESNTPENGRLRLKLWIYNESGLKLYKNPNQLNMKS